MSWIVINTMSTWAAAVGAVTCFYAIMRLIRFQRQIHKEQIVALTEMADTYKSSWTYTRGELDQLKARLEWLEKRTPTTTLDMRQ